MTRHLALTLLLAAGASLAATPADERLRKAVGSSDLQQVQRSLAGGADPAAMWDERFSVLDIAALRGDVDILRALIAAGADVNAVNWAGSALSNAANSGRVGTARLLLEQGAQTEVRERGMTPMLWALHNGHREVAELLHAHGAKLPTRKQDAADAATVFRRGFESSARFLIDKGLEVNLADAGGENLLHAVIRGRKNSSLHQGQDHLRIVGLLIEAGIDRNHLADGGFTPLALAVRFGDEQAVATLLAARADANRGRNHKTPLRRAAYRGYGSITRALLAAGADARRKFEAGRNLLHSALIGWKVAPPGGAVGIGLRQDGDAVVVVDVRPTHPAARAGVKRGDRIVAVAADGQHFRNTAKSDVGNVVALMRGAAGEPVKLKVERPVRGAAPKPLEFALEREGADFVPRLGDHGDIVPQLVRAGVDVNAADNSGHTPIFFAADFGAYQILLDLIRAGGDVRRASSDGETPLMIAAQNGHARIALLLVEAGGDPYRTRREDNKDALFFAALAGHANVIDAFARVGFAPRTPEKAWKLLDRAVEEIESAQVIGTQPPGFARVLEAWQQSPSSPDANRLAANLLIEFERFVKPGCRCGLEPDVESLEGGVRLLHVAAMLTTDRGERRRLLDYHQKWLKSLEENFRKP